MDPITQGAIGASLPQALTKKTAKHFSILIIGWLSGMAPDLDVLIRSQEDPLLFLKYHRQFTHSLIFIPVGALFCSLLFYPFFKKSFRFKEIYLYSFLGYLTHGLIDSCTSYGTQLFWPFSNMRVAWNNISIIDPLFTFPILGLIFWGAFKNKALFARVAVIYALLYLSLGLFQNYRARMAALDLAKKRGHKVKSVSAKLSIANLFLWKTIYKYKGKFYIDAIHNLGPTKIYEGNSILELNLERDFPQIKKGTKQWNDIQRFSWFSMGHVAKDPQKENFIMDVRYSMIPNSSRPLWGIKLNPSNQDSHAKYLTERNMNPGLVKKFKAMLLKHDLLESN
ncbi:MAG: metal-dependent hydrolase [Halobacteriovoraceae bacterium]|nr:metal-dependent hydrolase [Halobacteriovoraceae bacterium]